MDPYTIPGDPIRSEVLSRNLDPDRNQDADSDPGPAEPERCAECDAYRARPYRYGHVVYSDKAGVSHTHALKRR